MFRAKIRMRQPKPCAKVFSATTPNAPTARQGAALGGVEQVPRPLDDRAQGALTGRRVARAREQPGPAGQPLGDLPRRQGAGAGGRQLNG